MWMIAALSVLATGQDAEPPQWIGQPATNEEACHRLIDLTGYVGWRTQQSRERAEGVIELVSDELARRQAGGPEAALMDDTVLNALLALRLEVMERRQDGRATTETAANAAEYFCPGLLAASSGTP